MYMYFLPPTPQFVYENEKIVIFGHQKKRSEVKRCDFNTEKGLNIHNLTN